jgi:hypothetical protein
MDIGMIDGFLVLGAGTKNMPKLDLRLVDQGQQIVDAVVDKVDGVELLGQVVQSYPGTGSIELG